MANVALVIVPTEARDRYQRIIDGILASADLNTISAKRIRKGLQTAVDHDISPYKVSALLLSQMSAIQNDADYIRLTKRTTLPP
jgi:upstream activation factor subunit UAF30